MEIKSRCALRSGAGGPASDQCKLGGNMVFRIVKVNVNYHLKVVVLPDNVVSGPTSSIVDAFSSLKTRLIFSWVLSSVPSLVFCTIKSISAGPWYGLVERLR